MKTPFTPLIVTFTLLLSPMAPEIQAATITVTSNTDNGPGSLRMSLASAANGDTIRFATNFPSTITLTSGELLVTKSLTILGLGPDKLAVDANHSSRVFHIAPSNTVSISSLAVINGSASSNLGGGILNDHATLTVSNCTFSGNSADFGGGILNGGLSGSATLKVLNSTFSGNWAGIGGGMYNYGLRGNVTLEVNNCTLSGNGADFYGGGIFNDGRSGGGVLKVGSCTFFGNSGGSGGGGGIYNYGISGSARLEVGNTILKNTGVPGQNILNDVGTVISLGYNLSGDATGPNNGITDRLNTDPLLGPLQNNGGATATHALLPGSPAIDKGNRGNLSTDQRGRPRPADFPTIPQPTGGDGSDIGAFELQVPALTLRLTLSGDDVLISFDTEVGLRYRIECKDTLTATSWTTVADNVAGTGSIVTVPYVSASRVPKCFFRGVVPP